MKNYLNKILISFFVVISLGFSQDNYSLDFDGDVNVVDINVNTSGDYTVSGWFNYDIADDGLSIGSVIHMPVGVSDRFRGLEMGYDNNLYVTTDSGNIMKISAE